MASYDENEALGDAAFMGVQMRRHPSLVPPGFVSAARNARFTDGKVAPRRGSILLPWTNRVESVEAVLELTPFGRIFGDGEFTDGDGLKWWIIAADGGVWKLRENNGSSPVPMPPGVTVWRDVAFTLGAGGVLLLWRGRPETIPIWNDATLYIMGALVQVQSGDVYEQIFDSSLAVEPGVGSGWEDYWRLVTEDDYRPLVMDDIDQGFKTIVTLANDADVAAENPDDGTDVIPSGRFGIAMQNRVFVPYENDFVAASDYLNYTRYQPVLESFRVAQGDGHRITALFEIPEQDSTQASSAAMLVGKEGSVHIVSNARGALDGLARYRVTNEYGTVNERAVWSAGRDVWFVARSRGISSLAQTESGKWQGVDLPVSDPIQPVIDRINWRYAHKIIGIKSGNFSYVAVPLDNAEVVKGDIIRATDEYSGAGALTVSRLIAGRRYRWVKGANDTSLNNSGDVLTASGDFVALGSVTLNGTASAAVTANLYPLFQGVNNAVLVYDHLNGAWAGYDDGAMLCPRGFRNWKWHGADRLFMLGEDGFISLYEEGSVDHVSVWERETAETEVVVGGGFTQGDGTVFTQGDGTVFGQADVSEVFTNGAGGRVEFAAVQFHVQTRGYALASRQGRWRAKCLDLQLRTWNPAFNIMATLDGANETQTIKDNASRDRTRYRRPHTRPRWDDTNVNDDHGTRFREDYSVALAAAAGFYLGTGVDFGLHQESTETYRCPASVRGGYVQFALDNAQGRAELHGVAAEVKRVDRRKGVKL